MPTLTILQAPSRLGLSSDGVQQLAARLLDMDIDKALGATRGARVESPIPEDKRDPETTILNAAQIRAYAPSLAEAFGEVLDSGAFPIVLGGDCTILLGTTLALRRRGRYGLLFIDGHADFFQPEAEPNGEGASMELAWVTGHGPSIMTRLEGFEPLVRPEDVVVLGFRDHADQAEYHAQPLPADTLIRDLPAIRRRSIEDCMREALTRLDRNDLDGFFIHLDADVLDDAIMPAVDFRIPGGLSIDEVTMALRMALQSGKAVGLEVTIYNPGLDEDGSSGRRLVNLLADAFSDSAHRQ